ncbi:MAG TPA: hypothetical protein VJQ82_11935 [Terriglobales bacterium]|nr:hypothetical protein [Terriglobales bacterium]
MEMMEIEIVEVELKYCERCGGLWLRPCGSTRVFCASCAPKMAALEIPEDIVRLNLPEPIDDGEDFDERLEHLAALCGEGGNA